MFGKISGMHWFLLVGFSKFLYERDKLQLNLIPLESGEILTAAL